MISGQLAITMLLHMQLLYSRSHHMIKAVDAKKLCRSPSLS